MQRPSEEHLDRVALIGAVATSIGVEIAAHFQRIELRVSQRDRKAVHAALGTLSMRPDPLGGGGTCFCRVHSYRGFRCTGFASLSVVRVSPSN
jgi:hypothetical protein